MRTHRLHRLIWAVSAAVLVLMLAVPVLAQISGGRVCVTAFHDDNQNGTRDAIEPLLGEMVVHLLNAQNVVIANYRTTGVNEPHCFDGLVAGTYSVRFFAGPDWTPTRQESFSVTLSDGQTLPAQVQFGAVPAAPDATTAANTASASADNTLLRVALGLGGAALAVFVMAFLGLIIYSTRFRR
ncbi:MAG: hypothetical protein JW910_03115 [Anaerolineae bacterium]|nr:hypothetical protein [Anaerolineae bacterium]